MFWFRTLGYMNTVTFFVGEMNNLDYVSVNLCQLVDLRRLRDYDLMGDRVVTSLVITNIHKNITYEPLPV